MERHPSLSSSPGELLVHSAGLRAGGRSCSLTLSSIMQQTHEERCDAMTLTPRSIRSIDTWLMLYKIVW